MFLSTVVNVLKKALVIGAATVPSIVGAYNAPLGALLSTVFNGILTAQGTQAAASPDAKKEMAMAALQAALPAIEQLFAQNNKVIHDPETFAKGVDLVHDGLLSILNSTGAKLDAK